MQGTEQSSLFHMDKISSEPFIKAISDLQDQTAPSDKAHLILLQGPGSKTFNDQNILWLENLEESWKCKLFHFAVTICLVIIPATTLLNYTSVCDHMGTYFWIGPCGKY